MANLNDSAASWETGIYQIETTDPVIGGTPDPATGEGTSNIPHLQLALRTRWLKAAVDALLATVANNLVHNTRAVNSGGLATGGGPMTADRTITVTPATAPEAQAGTRNDVAMTPASVKAAIAARAVNTGGLATGGGLLWVDRTITVTPATVPEAQEGTRNDVAMTPASVKAAIASALSGLSFVPTGVVADFAMPSAPSGWLPCDGRLLSRTTYAPLFAAIGTTWGAGDGWSTFNIPDFRGEFRRGWDAGRGLDAGRSFASIQGDAIRNITGRFSATDDNDGAALGAFYVQGNWGTGTGGSSPEKAVGFDASRVVPTANENRPRNVAVLTCIKI